LAGLDLLVDRLPAGFLAVDVDLEAWLVPLDLLRADVVFSDIWLPEDFLEEVADFVDWLLVDFLLREDVAAFLRLVVLWVGFSTATGRTISRGAVRLVTWSSSLSS